jgi:exodeoxyribonuclease VII small subunit
MSTEASAAAGGDVATNGTATTSTATTYESAVERLEEIIRRLDSNQAGLRETLELCTEGKGLIEFAAGELEAVGQGLQELRLDELIARLEATPAQSPA